MASPFDRFAKRLEVRYRAVLALIAGVVFLSAVTVAATTDDGSGKPPAPGTTTTTAAGPTTTTAAPRPGLDIFSSVTFTVASKTGSVTTPLCGLLAETPEQLAKGLKNRKDGGGYVSMVFKFAENTRSAFYMFDVSVPLAIAWFDEQGQFVSSAEMAPCTVEEKKCPLYRANGQYRYAVETKSGGLGELGIGEGSRLQLGDSPCS